MKKCLKDCAHCFYSQERQRPGMRVMQPPEKFLYCNARFKKVEPYEYCGSFQQDTKGDSNE